MATVKVWNGSSWVSVRPKAYNGSAWLLHGNFRNTAAGWEPMYPTIDAGIQVSAVANGQYSEGENIIYTSIYAGALFSSNGSEYEYNAFTGGTGNYQGDWLVSGNAADVWIVFNRTSGATAWDSAHVPGTRYNLSTSRGFYMQDVVAGGASALISGYFEFYDAVSGGNLLERAPDSGSSTWEAKLTINTCPTCCFTPDTLILMADNTHMPIGEIQPGDLIRVENGIEAVGEVIVREMRAMHMLTFENGSELILSDDHPIFTESKGYAAVNPIYGEYKDLGIPKSLEVGDRAIDEMGRTLRITSIDKYEYRWPVYTLSNSRFFAGGVLVY